MDYNNLYYTVIGLFSFGMVFYLLIGRKNGVQEINIPIFINFLIFALLIFIIGFYPVTIYSDKYNYKNEFDYFSNSDLKLAKDVGWTYYIKLSKLLWSDSDFFFVQTASLYLLGYIVFFRKLVDRRYLTIVFLATVSAFAFFGYGINTIRAGLALSILLISIAYRRNLMVSILIGILAISIHKSVAIIFLAFLVSYYIKNIKFLYRTWFIFLILSFLNFSFLEAFILNIVGMGSSNRFEVYLTHSGFTKFYNAGFRIDFIIYSFIPILLGYYYTIKKKFDDPLYKRLFSVYLMVNSIWLLVIRIPFTDRVAYLSWFLIPFLLLYPLLKRDLIKNQRGYIALILAGLVLFSVVMAYK